MKTTTAILIAAALTAFVLVLAGSLVYAVNSKTVSSNLAAQDQAVNTQPLSGEPVVERVAPTNTFIPATISPTSAPPKQQTAPTQPKLVSIDRATQIALRLLPGSSLLQPPELVNYKGKMAYKVLLNIATVYIDAFNGKILASNAILVQNQQPPTDTGTSGDPGGGGNGGEQVRDTNPQSDPGINNNLPNNEPPQGGGSDDNDDDDEHKNDHGKKKGGEHKGGGGQDDDDDEHKGGDD